MKKITEPKYQINQREFELIKKCVDYALHRWDNHEKSGIRMATNRRDLKQLRDDIKKLMGEFEDKKLWEIDRISFQPIPITPGKVKKWEDGAETWDKYVNNKD